jgi:hypothetical protein
MSVCLPQIVPSLVLCNNVQCHLHPSAHSLCTSQCTVWWFCVTMSTAILHNFHSPTTSGCTLFRSVSLCRLLSSAFSSLNFYLTINPLLLPYHYVYRWFLKSVHPLSTCNCTVFVSLFLRPILSFKFCPVSVYFSLYDLLFLCQYVHCYLLHSVQCLTPSQSTCISSVSLYPLPSSAVCPLYVYHRLYSLWFSVSVPTAIVHILWMVCKLTLYCLLVLCHYVK